MIKVAEPIIDDKEIDVAISVLKSGNYTSGKYVQKFEEMFAEYIGVKYAVAVNSGTAALHLSLLSLGLTKDRYSNGEVIVPPMTFFATISSVLNVGLIPNFVDTNYICNIDHTLIESNINENTLAIIPVHFYGHPCNMNEIMKIANKYNLFVIEDCAQAHGASINNKKVGSYGITGCFSFFATKNMTTIEGGMITTDEKFIYEKAKKLRSHGMIDRDTHSLLGYNYRMNELSGAIGIEQLKKLDMLNKKRIENSEYLSKNIKQTNFIQPLYNENFLTVSNCKNNTYKNVYFWFPITTMKFCSVDLKNHLKKNDIGFRSRYNEPLYKQPLFREYTYKPNRCRCENAELFSGVVFGLPNHPGLSREELDKVIDVVNTFEFKVYDEFDF